MENRKNQSIDCSSYFSDAEDSLTFTPKLLVSGWWVNLPSGIFSYSYHYVNIHSQSIADNGVYSMYV